MQVRLQEALQAQAPRMIDLFLLWDEDRSNTVTKKEFRQGIPALGVHFERETVDSLFDMWDTDGNGTLCFDELNRALRRGNTVSLAKGTGNM